MSKPLLFTPFKMRGVVAPNRCVVSPMVQYRATDGMVNDYHLVHLGKFALGKFGIVFSFESATCLGDKLDNIDLFRGLGVRVMQLSYNLTSPFGAGVLAPADAGLTDLGRKAIERMPSVTAGRTRKSSPP